jgi:hypothetical protein
MYVPTAVVPTKKRLSKSFTGSIEVNGGLKRAGRGGGNAQIRSQRGNGVFDFYGSLSLRNSHIIRRISDAFLSCTGKKGYTQQ